MHIPKSPLYWALFSLPPAFEAGVVKVLVCRLWGLDVTLAWFYVLSGALFIVQFAVWYHVVTKPRSRAEDGERGEEAR